MLKRLQKAITSPKARAFLLLLFCSVGAWLISRLSETYTHSISFPLTYENAPDSLILISPPPSELKARLRASGFQLLRYQLSSRPVRLDLSKAPKRGTRYFVSAEMSRTALREQLDDAVDLVSVPQDTLRYDFQALKSRTITVQPNVELELAQNFMLDGELQVRPSKIHVLGPPGEIDTLRYLTTEPLRLSGVREGFQRELRIQGTEGLSHTKLSENTVQVTAEVFRFSEIMVEVPVEVSGVPEGVDIRTFPDRVGLLCKGKMEVLKTLDSTDFRVLADYEQPDSETGRLPLILADSPEAVSSSELLESSVEFIVRRE